MYVKNWFNKNFEYIYLNKHVKDVLELIHENKECVVILRHDNTLYNIIRYEDIEFLNNFEGNKEIYEILDPVDIFLYNDDLIEDAMLMMLENRVKIFPVVDHEMYPVGIFGFYEIVKAFRGLSSMEEDGTKIMLVRDDVPGELKKLLDIISKENINILSLMTHKIKKDKRIITLKINIKDVSFVSDLFDKNGIDYEAIFEEEASIWDF
ncbi:CBS domain-containing protein [Geotoga petraea]|jgi:acetoin utilization protein AcuB|uniref:Acetoin utilization protein AcuB n=1 Tax=Geotoga petraea TaxID=28234 RepID=A0A1G6QNR4_9BACT|nr:CBS domain-containing protein [Geotoga petraea]MDK2946127.1 acetoin utilization protein AcuB [Geotoga sp.]TGG86678.1 CBS domain-containing protein [Geotoga petraea]SDC93694.1 acetoin utilization protein AcuB [Geotoga petraea]